jgi:hypothetical protein
MPITSLRDGVVMALSTLAVSGASVPRAGNVSAQRIEVYWAAGPGTVDQPVRQGTGGVLGRLPRSCVLADIRHTECLYLTVLLELGRKVERVTGDELEDVESAP